MRGFKSFADKTIVEFKNGVTCVVGPNGSGKSNITDAVRWVLGEQRVKTLRGAKMEDVIFSGTKHRKSLGLAEVKLTFDNTEQFFPLDYDEISVVRRVHRSGESEYLINQMPCRLKDVRELFMDTGIGREGYSIIGQGRIDEVLSNNKDERRMLFEEAAGIVKYKSRKTETERKLKVTTENMLRIKDILSEIEDRVLPLQKESARAQKYLTLIETLKNIEVKHFANRYLKSEQNILNIINAKTEQSDELNFLDQKRSELQTSYDENDKLLYQINQSLRRLEERLHESQNNESKTIGEKQLLSEKIANTDLNINRIKNELLEIERDIENIKNEKTAQIAEQEAIELSYVTLKQSLEGAKTKRNEAQERLNEKKIASASDRDKMLALLNAVEIKKQEIENLERYKNASTNQLQELELQLNEKQNENDVLEELKKEIQIKKEALAQSVQELEQKIAKEIENNRYFKEEHKQIVFALEKETNDLAQITTEKKLLDSLEEDFEGYDKGVKEILKGLSHKTGIMGIVASLIEVPKSYETAIEVALGRSLQNIVCEAVQDAKSAIDYLRKHKLGRVTFLPLEHFTSEKNNHGDEELKELHEGVIGLASKLIKYDAKYNGMMSHLLGRVLIVDTFDTATELLKNKKIKFKIITLKGDVLVPGGAITGGSFKSKVSNVLGRKRRISELEQQIISLEKKISANRLNLKHYEQLIEENEGSLKELRMTYDEKRMGLLKLENSEDNHHQNKFARLEAIKELKEKIASIVIESNEQETQIDEKRAWIEASENQIKSLESQLVSVKSDIENSEDVLQTILDEITSVQIQLVSIEQNKAFKQKEIDRVDDDLKTFDQKRTLRRQQLDDYVHQKSLFTSQSIDIDEAIRGLNTHIRDAKESIEENNEEKNHLSHKIKKIASEIAQITQKQEALKEKTHKIEVQLAKLEVEKDTIVAELWDKYEMSIGEAVRQEIEVEDVDLKSLKLEIKLMGTVNVNAIEEYEEVSERHKFLVEQRDDLLTATTQLEKIIKELDQKMIELFKVHFESINEHFKGTFKALFNGGDAELLLTDYDDLLNCDIDIIAQPPGKKLQSINLLSGGEKALTAIALLFAILKTKPSPFCILDEIEAALDDVNVYRFAEFIKIYAEKSQFVVITHRKGTMEIADTLYGVTMEEYGVSKVLSVRLEDVEDKFN